MERLRKLHPEVETDQDSDFDNEGNGPEDILEVNLHESFSEHDTESKEEGDAGKEELHQLQSYQRIGFIVDPVSLKSSNGMAAYACLF
ncbi:hypothetical protein AVEN_224389-1 [Araneus ventricosus]|uniref:Uncharacterized protein n=1 Tax=Araneus ventricosus TaxID=182803 RepID=A0A4Y2F7T0_ARAVE|nr:hypothetical protein AVEN_224389-1 [Araneus ventricosus]